MAMGAETNSTKSGSNGIRFDKRLVPRQDVLEFGMLWLNGQSVPHRLGPVMITNAGLGGVQIRTRQALDETLQLLLELGSDDGPIFIPGDICYVTNGIPNAQTGLKIFGFRFKPKTRADRQAVARYMLSLRDKLFANC